MKATGIVRQVSGFDNLDTAIDEAYRKVDTVQKKIRGFMQE